MRAARLHVVGAVAVGAALLMSLPISVGARPVAADNPPKDKLTADLDGKPIDLSEVGNWYCDDFDYPAIHCFSDPSDLESSTAVKTAAAAAVTYVTVYEFTTYQGAYLHMSQDYGALGLIGWNDRISSLVVHNSAGGVFWSDWLYSGTRYSVCCYQQLGSLGSFNDTFSSVFHR